MNNETIYYKGYEIFSYNALLNFIITERGLGKSYFFKKWCVKHFLKKNKQFVYIRRYKSELKEAMMKNKTPKFFEQIKNDDEMKNIKLSNTKDTMTVNGKICGYAIPLSIANILKSSTYDDVDTIIFDEFLIDKGNYHYLQNEVYQLLDVIETVARLRDINVYFLGNAISITNPYFEFFNLSLPYNSEIKTFKNGLILVQYKRNSVYREIKKKSRFGKLIEGTDYGKYAIDNQMLRDSKSFIMKKSKNAKFYFILKINGKKYGIWNDYMNGYMYISKDYDPNCPVTFSLNSEDHDEKTMLIRGRSSPFFKSMIEHYRLALLCFENQSIKNNIMPIISKHLTY